MSYFGLPINEVEGVESYDSGVGVIPTQPVCTGSGQQRRGYGGFWCTTMSTGKIGLSQQKLDAQILEPVSGW